MTTDSAGRVDYADAATLDAVRARRAALRGAMVDLEAALAAPYHAIDWTTHVRERLLALRADLARHVEGTEGPGGLYQELRSTAPRLGHAVDRLTREHAEIRELIDELLVTTEDGGSGEQWAEEVRDHTSRLLGRLVRHRQRGSDLIFEAYQSDIGGET